MKLRTKSGKQINPVGIGTWGFGGKRESVYGEEAAGIEAIRYSIAQGQNHIDGAQLYGGGHTDDIIGDAIQGLPRNDLFLTSKLWETSIGVNQVQPAVSAVLEKLNTDYLDMLYLHYPFEGWQAAVPQIDALIDKGIVRYFGVSNFTVKQIQEAMQLSKHPIAAVQLHYSVLYKKDATKAMRDFCKRHDIQVIAYLPVERADVMQNETIKRIADAHGVTPVQVALAWLLAHNAYPIPKATQQDHIKQNLAAVNITFSSQEMEELDRL